jgi:hypothetical protein
MAAKVTAEANSKFVDPEAFWGGVDETALQNAQTLAGLADVIGLTDASQEWLHSIEGNLTRTVVKGIIGGYQAAADTSACVQIVWVHHSGYKVTTTSSSDGGAVSIVVHAPASLGG